jgi:uncharacterized protein
MTSTGFKLGHEIATRLKSMQPRKIILFGSHARGTAGIESDVDLVFISDENRFLSAFSERIQHKQRILERLRDIEMPIDLLFYTKVEWEAFLKINNALATQIISEGIEIETEH